MKFLKKSRIRAYLPSRKFSKIAASGLLVLAMAYYIFLYAKTYSAVNNPDITTTTTTAGELINKDIDGDRNSTRLNSSHW